MVNKIYLSEPYFLNKVKNSKVIFLEGYAFRDPKNFAKYSKDIRKFFTPTNEHIKIVDKTISKAKIDCDILIGVHIRRGDYSAFKNGLYFYSDNEYRKLMLQACSFFRGKRIKFLLFSNERIVLPNFYGLKVEKGPGHFIDDLYTMSRCDYIIGPPSSFSSWAAFYGNIPLWIVFSGNATINQKSFIRYECPYV